MKRLLLVAALWRPLTVLAVRAMLRRNVSALMNGDPGPLLNMYADDAVLEFPGESSWGPEYRGKEEIAGFLRRFLDVGLRGTVGQVWVSGPPWATKIALEFDDWAPGYENRAVIVFQTRLGKIVRERVYEDTQKVAAFDELLMANAA